MPSRMSKELKKSHQPSSITTNSPLPTPVSKPKKSPLKSLVVNQHVVDEKLDFWIKAQVNVLFVGKHGTGKTARVVDAFNRNNLKWKYFNAATMDPWVDFIGVPKERKDEDGNSYLDLVRPKEFMNDEVEAILLDEYNRSAKKVRNAVMELIQFKSINGKKFNNLKIVWAAVNPPEDGSDLYDVEEIDPAQLDRFQVQILVPYLPDRLFFQRTYGGDIADIAIEWWQELPEKIKNLVSPRRLDEALKFYKIGGDLKDILPKESNPMKLMHALGSISAKAKIQEIYASKNKAAAKEFIRDENNYATALMYLLKHKSLLKFFVPLMPEEKITTLMAEHDLVLDVVLEDKDKNKILHEIIDDVVTAKLNKELVEKINKKLA